MNTRTKDKIMRLAALVLSLGAMGGAWADITWSGTAASGDWANSSNWTGSDGDYYFTYNADCPADLTVTFSGEEEISSTLKMKYGINQTVTFSAAGDNGLSMTGTDTGLYIGGNNWQTLIINGGKYSFKDNVYLCYERAHWYDGTSGTLTISAGDVTVAEKIFLGEYKGEDGSTATLNLEGGSLTVKAIDIGTGGGTGVINFKGGELVASDAGTLVGSGVTVTVETSGGTINTDGKAVSIASVITGSGTLTITGGGSVTFRAIPTCNVAVADDTTVYLNDKITISNSDGTTRSFVVSAGTVYSYGDIRVANGGNGASVDRGVLTISGTGHVLCEASDHTEKWVYVGGKSSNLNINEGGTLSAWHIHENGNGSGKYLNINGGTLRALGDSSSGLIGTGVKLKIGANGGTIDTNGFDVDVNLTENSCTGALLIRGGGSVTFSAQPTFQVNVLAGTKAYCNDEEIGTTVYNTWKGTSGAYWNSDSNWTYGVPTADQIVKIEDSGTILLSGWELTHAEACKTGALIVNADVTFAGGWKCLWICGVDGQKGISGSGSVTITNNTGIENGSGSVQEITVPLTFSNNGNHGWLGDGVSNGNEDIHYGYGWKVTGTTTIDNCIIQTDKDVEFADALVSNGGTINTMGNSVAYTGSSITGTGLTISGSGSFTLPTGLSICSISASGATIGVNAEYVAATTYLTADGDCRSISVVVDGKTLVAAYDNATGKTTWASPAYTGDYITKWRLDFEDTGDSIANGFSLTSIDSTILDITSSDVAAQDHNTVITEITTMLLRQQRVAYDGGYSQCAYVKATHTGRTVFANVLYTMPEAVTSERDYILSFDWHTCGYGQGGLVLLGNNGTILTVKAPASSSGDATATIYKGDDSSSTITTVNAIKTHERSGEQNLPTGEINAGNGSYWYRFTIKSNDDDGIVLTIKRADGTVVVEDYDLSDTADVVTGIFMRTYGTWYNYSGLDNLELQVPQLASQPYAPTLSLNTTANISTFTLAASSEANTTIYYKIGATTADYTQYTPGTTVPIPNSENLYYYEVVNGVSSEVKTTFVISNTEAVQLIAPTIRRNGFNYIYAAASQNTLVGHPTPTMKATNSLDEELTAVLEGTPGYIQTTGLDANGTYSVYASSDGYANSSSVDYNTIRPSIANYAVDYEYDCVAAAVATGSGSPLAWADSESETVDGNSYKTLKFGSKGEKISTKLLFREISSGSSTRWKDYDYSGFKGNTTNKGYPEGILVKDVKANQIVYVNCGTFDSNYGVAKNVYKDDNGDTKAETLTVYSSGTCEYQYLITHDGSFTLSMDPGLSLYAVRVYSPAVAQVNGVGYLTVADAVDAAAATGSNVAVVDATALSGQAVALKPGVALTGLGETAVGNVTVTTTVNDETVDMTSYYTTASLAVVNGQIAPVLDEAEVGLDIGTVEVENGAAPSIALSLGVKKGLYYGIASVSDPAAVSPVVTVLDEQLATADGQSITVTVPAESAAFGENETVKYYKLSVSDTASVE